MNAFLNDVQTMVNETDTDNNICLISQTVLQNDYVTLECGHKYNYGSIFQELKNQLYKDYLFFSHFFFY